MSTSPRWEITPTDARALGTLMRDVGLDRAGLREIVGEDALSALDQQDPGAARHRLARVMRDSIPAETGGAEPAGAGPGSHPVDRAVLAALFIAGMAVPRERALTVLGGLSERLLGGGVLGSDDAASAGDEGSLRATLRIVPEAPPAETGLDGDLLVASDHDASTTPGVLADDHVLGVGGATRSLAAITLRDPVDTLLDLGTGCGYHALLACGHAERVIATDISARALDFAALTIALNADLIPEVERIELREGSLFEPVPETVDQIVSNPPFVITPRQESADGRVQVTGWEHRDGGMVGDGLVRAVLAQLPHRLNPGGSAQLLANWEHTGPDEAIGAPALDMLDAGSALVVERERLSPEAYTRIWVRDAGLTPAGPDADDATAAWLEDFAARGVAEIGLGWVLLRASGEDRVAARIHDPQTPGLAARLEQRRIALIGLRACSDDELEAGTFTAAGDVTEERHHWPGAEHPSALLLRRGSAPDLPIPSDTALSALVGASDGELGLGDLIDAIAMVLEVDRAALAAELRPGVRDLVALGVLIPTSGRCAQQEGSSLT